MIPTIGHASVLIGLGLTTYAVVAFVLAARGDDPRLASSGRRAVIGSFVAALVGCAVMVISLLTHDFSVRYVAENNATTTPPFISAISLWAALEGSILFWALLATGWASLVLWRNRDRHAQLMPWVGATLASVNAFFFAVMTWPGNPFALTAPAAAEGVGPNALLQNHPFMALHPPLLYLGYTGLAVPFAFGVAALVTRRLDEEWLRIVRRWTLVPWIFLTLGITAGAWWSYEVLGWGGYWAWDPVENAALLPWLTATAFVHSAMVAERRGGLRIWTSALVIATFVLTLVGTFLTRSGVVASVHSFTQSAIGPWFLAAIVLALAGPVTLLVWRLPELVGGGRSAAAVSRESAFLFNNVLFLGLTFAVLFGTLLPLIIGATSGDTISVGAPWFNGITVPIFVALLFLMGVGPALPWGAARWTTVRERFTIPLAVAVAVGVGAFVLGLRAAGPLGTLSLAAFVAAVMGEEVVRGARARARTRAEDPVTATWRMTTRNRRRYGGYTVHVGVLVMAVAVSISSGLAVDATVTVAPGETARIGAYEIRHERLVIEALPEDPRVTETRAELTYSGPQSGSLGTAVRDYPNSPTGIATPAVRTSLAEDLYVTLLAADPDTGAVTLHLFVNPLVVWIWLGGAVVGIGSAFAIWPEGRRVAEHRRAAARGTGHLDRGRLTMRHLRWLLVPAVIGPLVLVLLSGFGRDPREISSPLIGRAAPSWTLTTLDGGSLSSADLAGRPYVVNFWASWCIPACVDEHPVLAAAHAEHGDAVPIVGVLYQDTSADAQRFLGRYGDAGYPHLIDPNGSLGIDFGVTGPPETFFVDATGIIRDKRFGPLTDALMAEHLSAILPSAGG